MLVSVLAWCNWCVAFLESSVMCLRCSLATALVPLGCISLVIQEVMIAAVCVGGGIERRPILEWRCATKMASRQGLEATSSVGIAKCAWLTDIGLATR